MASGDLNISSARRRVLYAAVASVCYEVGFTTAERSCLETLTEMLQSLLNEMGRSSRSFCELGGRTEVTVHDVFKALVDMGINTDSLVTYAKRPNRITLPTPASLPKSSTSRILQAGEKRSLPGSIPEYYPSFPDAHTYIRTPTHRQPITEYEIIREKAATQKRDTERALTRFRAKTGNYHSLYPDDNALFPLIACHPIANPNVSALLFSDQLFDEEKVDKSNKTQSPPYVHEGSENPKDSAIDNDIMDNPYLRPVKVQKRRRK